MRFWLALSCFYLCAAPLAAEPLRSGEMRLSPAAGVQLAPRIDDFLPRLCSAGKGLRKNSAICREVTVNLPKCCFKPASLRFGIHSMQALEGGLLRASLFARTFSFAGPQPLETSCGRWTWSLRLDPRATQPLTAVTLRSGARDATAGTFSTAALPLHAQIAFQKIGDGRQVVVPVLLRLEVTGTWTVAAESALPGAPAESRLLFSIDSAKSVMTPEGAEK
jgi:hypothetical protein